MFAFYLISFLFANMALFTGLLALCSRLGGYRKSFPRHRVAADVNPVSALTTFIALFFQALAAALMT